MPWNLSQRDGKWCVVKQGESDPVPGGCHPDRASAIKHQRALYANESRMASMYAELDAQPDPEPEPEFDPADWSARETSRVVRVEIPADESLTASVMEQMERMSERQTKTEEALIAALQAISERESVVNVHPASAPNVTVEAPPPANVVVNVPTAAQRKTLSFSDGRTATIEEELL